MSEIQRLLRAEAQKVDPSVEEGRARVQELARGRNRVRRLAAAALAMSVAGVSLVVTWQAFRGPSALPVAESTASPTSSIPPPPASPTPPLPEAPGWFIADTYREADTTVMPVTFPEGTQVELLYPHSLDLARLGINPNTYGSMPGTGCGGNLLVRSFDARGEIFEAEEPVAVFEMSTGGHAELWPGMESWPGDWLVFQFGHWQVLVNCPVSRERALAGAEEWASALRGEESADGFLVLTARDPLKLAATGDRYGPELFIEGPTGHTNLVLAPVDECADLEVRRDGGVVEWCVQGQPISVLVKAFGEDLPFINSVVGGLAIRQP